MNGPHHFSEGERLLAESEDASAVFKPDEAHALVPGEPDGHDVW